MNLMTQDGTPKDDVKVPDSDLGKSMQSDFDDGKDLLVTIVAAMGEEQVSCPLLSQDVFLMCFDRLSHTRKHQRVLNFSGHSRLIRTSTPSSTWVVLEVGSHYFALLSFDSC
jgi:hypothetical protein